MDVSIFKLKKSNKGGYMSYYFSTTITGNFDDIVQKTTEALKKEGFGVLTDIDVSATLKKKFDVDFKKYRILGACNPPFAFKALQAEDKIGTMLPCNVIVIKVERSVTQPPPHRSRRAVLPHRALRICSITH